MRRTVPKAQDDEPVTRRVRLPLGLPAQPTFVFAKKIRVSTDEPDCVGGHRHTNNAGARQNDVPVIRGRGRGNSQVPIPVNVRPPACPLLGPALF